MATVKEIFGNGELVKCQMSVANKSLPVKNVDVVAKPRSTLHTGIAELPRCSMMRGICSSNDLPNKEQTKTSMY